jgi:hypothetical protein
MPLTTQILCDGCQAKKKDTNHWYTVIFRQQTAEVAVLTVRADGRPYVERDGLQQYYCGRYCILEAMNKWMDALTRQPSDPSLQLQLKNEQATDNEQPIEPARRVPPKTIVLKRSAETLRNTADRDP